MKKKILSLVLALLMAASSASAVLADEAIADVEETAVVEEVAEAGQYDKAIAFLANYGIFKGISADDLGADLDVNRYQMALFVGRISTGWVDDSKWEDGPENWSEFTDISEGAVADYWGALSYANAKGIIEGYGNGKFGPYDGITYQNALTMVVRTLGYTGLEWPWGYIEKAVSLGLTDGITDVAYTEELTRGETAQIIYNAMFAKTKGGSTLALDNFGVAFGWEKVIVTASDLNIFTKDKTSATLKADSDKIGVSYADSYKPTNGLVAFQILNDDGSLADDVYYVAAESLGLVGEHDDELAVGDAYYVLFEQDADDTFVNVVAYESLLTETLVNAGKTDDDGEAVEYAIEAWFDAHTPVSKYSSNAYINMTKSGEDEAIVFDANNTSLKVVTGTDYVIAIDMTNGNILLPKDGKDTDGNKWDSSKYDEKKAEFVVEYTWHPELKSYYKVEETKSGKLGINWISEAEMEKLFKDYTKYTYGDVSGFDAAFEAWPAKSAYATLKLFDTDLNGEADRGIYETYRLGYFSNVTNDDSCGCGGLESYKIKDVDTVAEVLDAYKAKEGKDSAETQVSITVRAEGVSCKHDKQRAWIVDDAVLAADEESGSYDSAYVLYNYDAETGALKIVKNISAGTDADSYVGKGVVRGYNLSKGSIVIGEETYKFNNYAELLGNGFRYAADNVAAKAVYGSLLEDLFNQYVKFVVVDGELVHIEVIGAIDNDLIVVDSYAGISADGYIVVNGYFASTLEYGEFRLASINGWMVGDAFYYDNKYTGIFNGSLLEVASQDKDEDVYFVNSINYSDLAKATSIDITVVDEGYMSIWVDANENGKQDKDEKATDVKLSKNDEYLVQAAGYGFITYTGKLEKGMTIKGIRINSTDVKSGKFVIVDATVSADFAKVADTALDYSYVLYLDGRIDDVDYDGQYAEDDKYLLGAVTGTVNVFDVLANKADTQYAFTNIDFKSGYLYYAIDGIVVREAGRATINTILNTIADKYQFNGDIEDADYVVGTFALTKADAEKFFGKKDLNGDDAKDNADARQWVGESASIYCYQDSNTYAGLKEVRGESKFYKDSISEVKYNYVTVNSKGYITNIESLSWDKFESLVKDVADYTYTVYFVYTVDGTVVCYLTSNAVVTSVLTTGTAKTADDKTPVIGKVEASVAYSLTTDADKKVAEKLTADTITLKYTGVNYLADSDKAYNFGDVEDDTYAIDGVGSVKAVVKVNGKEVAISKVKLTAYAKDVDAAQTVVLTLKEAAELKLDAANEISVEITDLVAENAFATFSGSVKVTLGTKDGAFVVTAE